MRNNLTRVLLVDDEADFTLMTAMALEGTGRYRVKQVNSARQVIATACDFEPDVILLDVMMPEMDGGEVALLLEAEEKVRDIPVIFLTALVAHGEAPEGTLRRGGRRYVAKPVSLPELETAIHEVLSGTVR